MNIFKKINNYLSAKEYKKYRKAPCLKCGILNWKYCYSPYIKKDKKYALEARICGNCGYKDTSAHLISDKNALLGKNLTFNIKK